MPYFVANCAVVSSPRSASKASFALKSAEYRFRLPVIAFVLIQGRTKLTHLPDIRRPPQRYEAQRGATHAKRAYDFDLVSMTGRMPNNRTSRHAMIPQANCKTQCVT